MHFFWCPKTKYSYLFPIVKPLLKLYSHILVGGDKNVNSIFSERQSKPPMKGF